MPRRGRCASEKTGLRHKAEVPGAVVVATLAGVRAQIAAALSSTRGPTNDTGSPVSAFQR